MNGPQVAEHRIAGKIFKVHMVTRVLPGQPKFQANCPEVDAGIVGTSHDSIVEATRNCYNLLIKLGRLTVIEK